MENHNRLKQKISRLLRSSSCGSCKSRTTSDVVARPETLPETQHQYQLIDLDPHPLPSIFKPKTELFSFPKVPFPSPLLTPQQKTHGPKCPPPSPLSPFITFSGFQPPEPKPRRKTSRKKRNRSKTNQFFERGSFDNYYDDSEAEADDDDDEKTTLFSSVSLSSDSSDSFGRNRASYEVGKPVRGECEVGFAPLQGKVKDSFVVKKRSSDPYDDFRSSMVEMIIERQIFGASDLEDLLRTFLSLNSHHHHRVIVQVYTEIWNALFSTFS